MALDPVTHTCAVKATIATDAGLERATSALGPLGENACEECCLDGRMWILWPLIFSSLISFLCSSNHQIALLLLLHALLLRTGSRMAQESMAAGASKRFHRNQPSGMPDQGTG